VSATLPSESFDAPPSGQEVREYISDMLSQLADLARAADEKRLELAIRLLAVEAADCDRRISRAN
jgi:hypothetical protein